MRLAVVFIAAGLCLARNSEDSVPDGIWREVGRDQLALLKAPLRLKERKWIAAALPIAGATTALLLTDTCAARGLPNFADQIKHPGGTIVGQCHCSHRSHQVRRRPRETVPEHRRQVLESQG